MKMRLRWRKDGCQAITGEFVWGGARCGRPTRREILVGGNWFRCCNEHWNAFGADR